MRHAFALVVATALLPVSGGAFAACESRGGLVCGSGAPQVSSDAALSVSRGGSFSPLAPGARVRAGDRVMTGDAGATLALGPSCQRAIGPGALVSLTRSGGRTCASVTETAGLPETVGEAAGAPGSQAAAASIAAGVAIAGGVGLALAGGGRNPPPTVSAQ